MANYDNYLSELDESKLTERQKRWLPHLKQAAQDNISLTEYAKRYSVSSSSLYAVQLQLQKQYQQSHKAPPEKAQPSNAQFLPIAINPKASGPSSQAEAGHGITVIFPNQIKIEIPEAFSHALLNYVLDLAL